MKKIFAFTIALLTSAIVSAHDFLVRLSDGQQLYFNVIDAEKNFVELTYPVNITSTKPIFSGKLTVPATVKYNNTVYQVKAVGKKAFVNDLGLTEVVLPAGLVKIDDFAFEGCTNLRNVVFPGNKVTFGSGTFFRCTSLSNVTLGGDWTTVDMKTFRWSRSLREINIPAKMQKVNNLKSLKYLERITVDANNMNFSAFEGVLYNKNRTELLCCPRLYGDFLSVPEGVTAIRWGALKDCSTLEFVVLPTTLKVLSYNEFSKLPRLLNITMKSPTPIMTAQNGSNKVFLLSVASPLAKLYVPKSALKAYKKQIVKVGGNYSEVKENLPEGMDEKRSTVPFEVKPSEVLDVKNIIGYKKIEEVTSFRFNVR